MALKIIARIMPVAEAPSRYTFQKWLRTLESLLPDIIKNPKTTYTTVDPMLAQRYEGDFYGLLIALGISANYHWIIMRINGMNTPTDFDGKSFTMAYPDVTMIEENLNLFRTVYKNFM